MAKSLSKDKYRVTVVSPANHFLFTPLLPSTAVGTLEFRCIQEPVRTLEGLDSYYQGKAESVDLDSRTVVCRDIFKSHTFAVPYDYLVVACGCKTNTFGTPGVADLEGKEVHYLKHLYHSRMIRNRILECFERASFPETSADERARMLTFVVVGGGPTSCEFTGELHDFIIDDVARWYPDLQNQINITLVEAGDALLSSFDSSLADYVKKSLSRRSVNIRLNTLVTAVEQLDADGLAGSGEPGASRSPVQARFSDGTTLPFGLMVWSAGLAQVRFVDSLSIDKGATGRISVDDKLQVNGQEGRVFALGDCAANARAPLAPLAKVAQQQGDYLASILNEAAGEAATGAPIIPEKPFRFFNPGSMAQIGGWKGVLDLSHIGESSREIISKGPVVTGFSAWLTWRSAYWGKQVSWANKVLIPMFWFKSWLFGRDISRF